MTREFCITEVRGHVLLVTLNRPHRRNSLHPPASHELGAVFDAFEADPDLWVAIVTGAGAAFSAGADLHENEPPEGMDWVPPSGFAGLTSRFDRTKPVVAAINGFALGGGFELALACDIIVAVESATFGLTEPRVGLAALGGGIQRLIREIGAKRANGLLLTGRRISARAGLELGFVNEVVPDGRLMEATMRWVDDILLCSPTAIKATKLVANGLDGSSVRQSMERMFDMPVVAAIFTSADGIEGPRAFAERRRPDWRNPD